MWEIFLFFLEIQQFLPGYSLSGCFINPALVNVLALSTQVFFSTEEFIIIASRLPDSCYLSGNFNTHVEGLASPRFCWLFVMLMAASLQSLPLSSHGCLSCVSVCKLPFPYNDCHHCVRAHTNPAWPSYKDPIIVSALTLTQHDLNLAWLQLQRCYFQTRSHSEVLSGHAVWGDTIQHGAVSRNNKWVSLVAQRQSILPANAGDAGSVPKSGRSPGEGNGSPLQYSCLGNPMERGAWRA